MKKLAAFAVLVLILGAGCVSNSTGGLEVALIEGSGQPTIRVDDWQFNRLIDVEDTLVNRVSTGFLEANLRVRNRTGKDFPLQYKFYWFDANGMEIQPGGRPWEQINVHGGEAVTLSATSPEKNAVKYVVRLRRIR